MSKKYYDHLDEELSEDSLSIVSDSWGGPWTEEKLDTFEDYVKNVYLKIMNKNRDKYHWKLIYFDAFAGSGSRTKGNIIKTNNTLLSIFPPDLFSVDEADVYQGAAERVVKIEKSGIRGFDYYYFIDKDKESLDMLQEKLSKYSTKGKLVFRPNDANVEIKRMAMAMVDNSHLKSLALLDPFGMQIDWSTISRLSGLPLDLFILIPTGVIINRLLGKDGEIMYPEKLENYLGMSREEIESQFYKKHHEKNLFGEDVDIVSKVKNPCRKIAEIYIRKLQGAFNYVTEEPLALYNRKKVPIYHFVFASQNKTACQVAQYIINKKRKHGVKN